MNWKPLPTEAETDPTAPLRSGLDAVAARLGVPSGPAFGDIAERWAELVGAQIAEHASPHALVEGTLVVNVDDARWATQLRWLAPTIVANFRRTNIEAAVETIEVRLRPASPK